MADSAEGLTTATEQLKINGNSNGNSNGDGASKSDILSSRGLVLAGGGEQVAKFKQLLGNPWDPKTNPGGIVNIGTAENYVMTKEVAKFARDNVDKVLPEPDDFSYGKGPWGTPRLREAMTKHINRLFHPLIPVEADQILFANGVTSLCEMLGFTIFDEGDAVLLSKPIYQAFQLDFGTKAKVQSVFAEFGDVDPFSLDAVHKYEEAIQAAQAKGIRVRALMLCHPHNPLGRCYPVETLIGIMQLCNWYHVHLLVDEIYAMSVYDIPSDPKTEKFTSVLTLETDKHINSDYLHLLYGMSKDMACGGLRLGCIYSRSKTVIEAMSATSMFHWSGNLNEKMATLMLEDQAWMDKFLEQSRQTLAHCNQLARKLLDEAGIKYAAGSNAGLFLWLDLRPHLDKIPSDQDPWLAEDALTGKMIANGVYVTNGKSLTAPEPGWYRLIFSQEEEAVREGISRIAQTVKSEKK